MLVTLLLACNSSETDSLGDCPADPGGDPGAWLLVERSSGSLGPVAVEGQIEVFHDQESMEAWWQSGSGGPGLAVDFSEAQAIGLVTDYVAGGEEGRGERLDAIFWQSEDEDSLVARVVHECAPKVDEAGSVFWVIWVTPIFPITRCDLPEC